MATRPSNLNLTVLATETSSQLQEIWGLIGISQSERDVFTAGLAASVTALYKNAVASQLERQQQLEIEIEALQSRIGELQVATGQTADGLVRSRGAHRGITMYRVRRASHMRAVERAHRQARRLS